MSFMVSLGFTFVDSLMSFMVCSLILDFQCSYVLVESEDGACQQERLRHVIQQPRSYIVNLEHLISHQRDAAHDEQHRTSVLRDLEAFLFHFSFSHFLNFSFSYNTVAPPAAPRIRVMM